MKKLVLVSILILQFYTLQQISAQTDTLSDVHPLRIGNEWVYSFNLVVSGGGSSRTDTGYVNYRVISSTISPDSIIWHMFAVRNFMQYVYGFPPRYIEDTTHFDIIELSSLRDKSYTPVYDQLSLFPFFPAAPDSESFYRFQSTNSNGEYFLDVTFFPDPWNPGFGYNVKYFLKKDIGILNCQADQFKGFPNFFIRTSYNFISVNSVHEIKVKNNDFYVSQNYPNPFNPSTKISWQTPVSSWQTLKVYDVLGNEITTLVNEHKPAGSYEVEFSATGEGNNLPSGVYFYQLKAGDYINTKKMILLK